MFSPDYATARARFLDAAHRGHFHVDSLVLSVRGPRDEELAIDVASRGTSRSRALVHSSGVHGVEGFAGSAVQCALLDDAPAFDGTLVVVHAVNPWGMAWLRRVNERGVDLNRNFIDAPGNTPPLYAKLDALLNPASPPPSSRSFSEGFMARIAAAALVHGVGKTKQAIVGGQYAFPKGIFYGGAGIEEGARRYRGWVREHLAACERVVAVDVHTGLGPRGEDTLLVRAADEERMKRSLGFRVFPLDVSSSAADEIQGGYEHMLRAVVANVDFVTQEFGTVRELKVLSALRDENRHHHYNGGALDHPSKRALVDAFRGEHANVVVRGLALVKDALALV